MINTEQPIWKPYPDYPFVEANQFGEIRTKDRIATDRNGRKLHIKGRVLKQQRSKDGYMRVWLSVNGKKVSLSVHRIVASCFIPNPLGLPEINHIDNDPTNNAISNLEWCTHEYNMAYKEKYGVSAAEVEGRPVIAINPETSEAFWFESQHEAERQLGVDQGNITRVVNGKYNQTGGYWFCNADKNAIDRTRAKFGDAIANKVEKLMSENCD